MDAARHVDGDAIEAVTIDGLDQVADRPFQGAVEAGAEQGVDDQDAAFERARVEAPDLPVPAFGVDRCIAFQAIARAKQGQTNRPARLTQQAGRDEAVAAVVAGSAQNGDGPRLPAPSDLARDGGARRFHEIEAGHAAGHRGGIGPAHLLDGQEGGVGGE